MILNQLIFMFYNYFFLCLTQVKKSSRSAIGVTQIRRFFAVVSWDSLRYRTVTLRDIFWVKKKHNISPLQLSHPFLNLWYIFINFILYNIQLSVVYIIRSCQKKQEGKLTIIAIRVRVWWSKPRRNVLKEEIRVHLGLIWGEIDLRFSKRVPMDY